MDQTETLRGAVPVPLEAAYRMDLPPVPPPAAGWPVLVGLHGAFETAEAFAARFDGLENAPYARLYLDGLYPVEVREESQRRIGRVWYHYTGDQEAFLQSLTEAGAHVERVLDEVADRAPINRGCIALCGYSMGGYLAGFHGLQHPSRFRALAIIASRVKVEALVDALSGAQGMPLLMLHGEKDRIIPIGRQEESLLTLEAGGVDARLMRFPGGHRMTADQVAAVDAFCREHLTAS